jgi:hypothetical protein
MNNAMLNVFTSMNYKNHDFLLMQSVKSYFFMQLTEKTGGVNKISIKNIDSGV